MADDPLEHVARPVVPWSTRTGLTECGRKISDVAAVIDLPTFVVKFNKLGKTRMAMTTCMTCWNRLQYGAHVWEKNPVGVLIRDLERHDEKAVIAVEVRALAALVDAHRQEYDDLITGLQDTTDLAARRAKRTSRG